MGSMDMWKRLPDIAVAITGVIMVVYHLVFCQYLLQGVREHRITHLGVALLFVFLVSLRKSRKFWPMKVALILLALGSFVYMYISYPRLEIYGMLMANNLDLIVGVIVILLSLEATRETFGLVLPIVAAIAIVYMFLGSYLPPGLFHAMPLKWDVIIETLTVGFMDTGIFGPIVGISATFIFLFMVFAALVQTSGASEFFAQIGNLVGRRVRSSSAMAAMVTSGLVGSVSGQVGPNVMITGSYTIPAMKKIGYTPEQAGAIEAAASTAGPIIPPVMGVAAFLMSGMTGISYAKIIGVAALPALIYILSGALYVEFQAKRMNVTPLITTVNYRELILRAPLFLISLMVIIMLLTMGYTPMRTSFWACITILILSLFRKQTRPSLKDLVDGLVRGALWGSSIAASCATLGLVVASLTNTGLGIKLPAALGALSGGNIFFLLILTGIASLILGTGMPASASYLVVAMVLAPVLIAKGIPLLAAHLFAFYLANFSYLTPPVALAALFGSRLAGGNFLKTALESVKVGIGGFILPFMIVWVGALTWDFSNPFFSITGLISCVITFVGLQASLIGYFITKLNLVERLILGVSPFCLILHLATKSIMLFVAGFVILVLMYLWQKFNKRAVNRID